MYYFAYGSNMSHRRLSSRIEAVRVGTGKLYGYQLRFHKPGSRDGTGKCNICYTSRGRDYVLGILYEICKEDKAILDEIEGVGRGYLSKDIEVEIAGIMVQAASYMATETDDSLKPLDWYKRHVLQGAIENGLEDAYISMIEDVEDIKDHDKTRKARELSIYG